MTDFKATPTIWEFFNDPAFVRVLAGPIGSGKSVSCCHALVMMAMQQKPDAKGMRRTRTAIVRNTLDQLRSTTMKTFMDWFGEYGHYKAQDKTFTIHQKLGDGTTVHADFMFLPLDEPASIRKALSLELTFLWINEARELHPDVVDGLLMRLRRFPASKDGGPTRSCALADSNFPDLSTWWHDKFENPPSNWAIHIQPPAMLTYEEYFHQEREEPDEEDSVEGPDETPLWVNPKSDNLEHLDPRYYPDVAIGKSSDFVDVYLRCRYGRSLHGVPVYERTFNPSFHVAEEPFTPLKAENYPIVVGLDFGRTPAAAIMQRNVYGQVVMLDELTSHNMGIETFLSNKLQPLLAGAEYMGCHIVVAPDPAGWGKQQIGEVSPVDVVKAAGFPVARPMTNDPERRVEAVERVLLRHVDGKPAFVVNPHCHEALKGFRYGYRYKVGKSGYQEPKPEKNDFSHLADAIQYGVMVCEGGAMGGLVKQPRREVRVQSAAGWT